MLAAGAQTFLRRAGADIVALLNSEKHILELIHARVGEQQRRIIRRQKRTRAHTRMAMALKILQKLFANFVTSHSQWSVVSFSVFLRRVLTTEVFTNLSLACEKRANEVSSNSVCLPLPLGEGWGEGLSPNCDHNGAAGFSPQSEQFLRKHQ